MNLNCISVDLESPLHREFNLSKRHQSDNGLTSQVTNRLLDLFNQYKIKATFFVTGEIFEWYPDLVAKIHSLGHEVAYHGHRHLLLTSKQILLSELKLSKKFIDKYHPLGFRAPKMFFRQEYYSILSDFGFKYDSSLYAPFSRVNSYSQVQELPAALYPYPFRSPARWSFPQDFKQALINGIPFGSGVFISLFPRLTQFFINRLNNRNQPAVLIIHPWQLLDSSTNLAPAGLLNWYRRVLYGKNIEKIIISLLKKNRFCVLKQLMK